MYVERNLPDGNAITLPQYCSWPELRYLPMSTLDSPNSTADAAVML